MSLAVRVPMPFPGHRFLNQICQHGCAEGVVKIWAKTKEFCEGKFLVVRRDGTIPDWPHFVLGARDPAAPAALRAYAIAAETAGMDPDFCSSVALLAEDFEAYRKQAGDGDPDAPPHRSDNEHVLRLMRHEGDLSHWLGQGIWLADVRRGG